MKFDLSADYSQRPDALGRADDLYALARYHALRSGVHPDDLEDCALEFVEEMLGRDADLRSPFISETLLRARLHRSAANFAIDFQRHSRRVAQREVTWPYREEDSGEEIALDFIGDAPSPEAGVLLAEIRMRIERALEDLDSLPRELFIRHYLHSEPLSELALETQRSPDAVRKVLKRACAHLRSTLNPQGMEDEESSDALDLLGAMRGDAGA